MSDPTDTTPKKDGRPKRSVFKFIIKSILAAIVLLVVTLGVSSYYFSYPFAWPTGFWSGQSSRLEERLSALEARIESELSNGAVGAQIDEAVGQSLTEFSSQQSQLRLESEATIKQEIDAVSAQIAQLSAEMDEISSKVSDRETEDQTQITRLQQLSDRVDRFQATVQEMRNQVNVVQSAVESGLVQPATRADLQDFVSNQAELIDAYWTVREIQEQIRKGSKARALESFSALLNRWRQSTNQVLNSLVPLMTQQQSALNEWTPTQWNQFQTLIQGWLSEVNRWHLTGAKSTSNDEAFVAQSRSLSENPGWLARVTRLFSGVVEVRPRDVAALSERDQRLARANIEQRLLLLQLAVASENVASTQAQAAALDSEIERLFDPSDTQSVRDGLQALAKIEHSPPPEPLKEVQQTIEQALTQP